MKHILLIISILLSAALGSFIGYKPVFAECPESSASANLDFAYIKDGQQEWFSAAADSGNQFSGSVYVDAGTSITSMTYHMGSILDYGSLIWPGGFITTDTNNSIYNYSGNGTPWGPYWTNPINDSSQNITMSAGQGCNGASANIFISILLNVPSGPVPTFTVSCSPSTQTITAGGSTSFNLSTTPQNGFSSGVTFSHGFSPSSGTLPGISYTNNGAVPSSTTTANISTSTSTTVGTYTITFTGSGGGQSSGCSVTLTVNAAPAGTYTLSISPSSADVLKGNSQAYTVSATCTGGLAGPITALSANSGFSNLSYTFSNTTINCGGSVTLTITNTGNVPSNQLSTPQSRLGQTLTVTGTAY